MIEHGPHDSQQQHHHHSHAADSIHPGHHHLLSCENVSVSFRMYEPEQPFFKAKHVQVPVIDNLTVSVHEHEILAIVGASGSGKTLLADTIMGLFEPNATVRGTIWFDGELQDAQSLARLRGNGISLVPQSVDHLDPLMRVGKQVEGFGEGAGRQERRERSTRQERQERGARQERQERGARREDAGRQERGARQERRERRRELFARYGLSEDVARLYPHQLSGGMARRVLLCCALMDNPKLIIADEPTPGLDLDLAVAALSDLRTFANNSGSVMLITHDIELALSVADRVAVFQNGGIVEETSVESFNDPSLLRHPLSRALWHAMPEHGFSIEPPTAEQGEEQNEEEAKSKDQGECQGEGTEPKRTPEQHNSLAIKPAPELTSQAPCEEEQEQKQEQEYQQKGAPC